MRSEQTPWNRSYTGYIDIEARHLFFYFFESRNDPDKDDVIFWTNGGLHLAALDICPGTDSLSMFRAWLLLFSWALHGTRWAHSLNFARAIWQAMQQVLAECQTPTEPNSIPNHGTRTQTSSSLISPSVLDSLTPTTAKLWYVAIARNTMHSTLNNLMNRVQRKRQPRTSPLLSPYSSRILVNSKAGHSTWPENLMESVYLSPLYE